MIPSIHDLLEKAMHAPALASVLKGAHVTVLWSGTLATNEAAALVAAGGRRALVTMAPDGQTATVAPIGAGRPVALDLKGGWEGTMAALRAAIA
jgi:hypothetical protein